MSALAPPAVRHGPLMGAYFGTQLTMGMAISGVASVLIPNRIAELVGEDAKVGALGLTVALGAVAGLIAQPLAGALSDRTRSRYGRRTPWVVGGMCGGAVALLFIGLADSLLWIAVLWCLAHGCLNAALAPLTAVVPDRTPVERRGVYSALGGLALLGGGLVGVAVASAFTQRMVAGCALLAGLVLLGCALFPLLVREGPPRERSARERPDVEPGRRKVTPAVVLRELWISPRRHPDFAWAFAARFGMVLGYQSILSFQLYILQDHIGLTRQEANHIFPAVVAVMMVGTVIGLVPAGVISDRMGRRKPLVILSSVIIAVSALLPMVSPTLPTNFVAMALAGLGCGCYLAVDQALMTLVLPRAEDNAKDLGILNIANSGAQALAPAVAALVIGLGGYTGLYGLATVLAVISALAILPIRSVR
ncbi:MFS transporter [Streptomyces sp. NPDC056486]|uniref:MFS transporter n=1 Tax=Streptomyces sp. NPDC056486 TaxID=3345835 RepID=UPI00368BE981